MCTPHLILVFLFAGLLIGCGSSGDDDISWDDDDSGADDDDAGDDDMVNPPDIDLPINPVIIDDAVVAQMAVTDLKIRNIGTGELEVRYIHVADSAGHVVSADDWSGTIAPDDVAILPNAIQATCIDAISVMGVLEISSNDPDEHKVPVDVLVNCIAVGPEE